MGNRSPRTRASVRRNRTRKLMRLFRRDLRERLGRMLGEGAKVPYTEAGAAMLADEIAVAAREKREKRACGELPC